MIGHDYGFNCLFRLVSRFLRIIFGIFRNGGLSMIRCKICGNICLLVCLLGCLGLRRSRVLDVRDWRVRGLGEGIFVLGSSF